jgi:hypothetical protein
VINIRHKKTLGFLRFENGYWHCGLTFVYELPALHLSGENIKKHLPIEKLYFEFSDAQAEVFCSLFWV